MILTPEILKSQKYALEQHAHKEYGEGIPYSIHIILVVSFVQEFIHLIDTTDHEKVIIASWLHDLMEDNGISYNEIKKIFGKDVAEIVYCVTNESGRDRHEKALKTYPKTATNRLAVFVKLADRLANSTYSQLNGSSMYEKYRKEYGLFEQQLYIPGEYESMWEKLKSIYEIENKIYIKEEKTIVQ